MAGNGVSRAYVDTAGGMILVGNPDFYLDGFPVAIVGNPVQSHGNNRHRSAVMVNGSSGFLVNGIPVCTSESQASCGHQATGSGSFTVGSSGRGADSRPTPTTIPPYQTSPASTPSEVTNPFWAATWYSPETNTSGNARGLTADDFNKYEYVKPLIWLTTPADQGGYIQQSSTEYINAVNNPYEDPILRTEFQSIINGLNSLPDGMRVLAPVFYWGGYLYYDNVPDLWNTIPYGLSGGTADGTLYQYGPNKGQTDPKFYDYNTHPQAKPVRYPSWTTFESGNPSQTGVTFTESIFPYDLPDLNNSDYGRRARGTMIYNRASDNIRGTTTYGGRTYKWSVASPWGSTAAEQIKNDWAVMCAELKNRGATIDYVAFDLEDSAISSFEINDVSTPLGITLMASRLAAIPSDARANESWKGDVSFNEVFTQNGKYQFSMSDISRPYSQHAQLNPGYIYYDAAIRSLRNSTLNYCFMDVLKTHYPDAGMSNYDSFKVNDLDWCYDVYGHPIVRANTTGDSSSPVLYWSWNFSESVTGEPPVYQIDPVDSTKIVRFTPQNPGIPFYNNGWNCFLIDMQTLRAAKRCNPDLPIRPWIRSRNWTGDSGFLVARSNIDMGTIGTRFYYEILRHAVLCGTQHFLYFNILPSPADSEEVNAVIRELNDIVGGYSSTSLVMDRVSFLADFIVSGVKAISGNNAGNYVWRITPKPGINLYSETGRPLSIDSDGGAWVITSSPVIPRYTAG